MHITKATIAAIYILIVAGIAILSFQLSQNQAIDLGNKVTAIVNNTNVATVPAAPAVIQDAKQNPPVQETLRAPIDRALERITKKPFGIKISPQDSPVQPERFSGYHTGVDFETFPDEANSVVSIRALCDGKVVYSQRVSGYGGVFIQSCTWQTKPITVLYGHLSLASIIPKIGIAIKAGQQIGDLGKGYSTETDGERKHLHLGIHRGSTINLRGYVVTAKELDQWIDSAPLITE